MDDTNKPIMLRVISSAVKVATRAGVEIRRISKTGQLGVVDKGIKDYQTEADRTAQRMIVATLSKKFPKSKIVGEESLTEDIEADKRLIVDEYDESVLNNYSLPKEYENVKEEDIVIWVDPLDGTAEFVKGLLDHVTVLIGISVGGKSVAGIIHQPFYGYSAAATNSSTQELTGRTIWGLINLGCFGIKQSDNLPEDQLIITTTASHGNANIENAIAALKPTKLLKVGGAGHKVLLVIEGKAHSYVFTSNGSKRWDTSAPEAVLRSLGGTLTDAFGNHIEYSFRDDANYQNNLGIVASINPITHDKIINGIPMEVKGSLLS